jgi:hypothetical protein
VPVAACRKGREKPPIVGSRLYSKCESDAR